MPRPEQTPVPAQAPAPLNVADTSRTVSSEASAQPAHTSLPTATEDLFVLRPQEPSDPIPVIQVPAMSFSNASPFEMIRAVVESVNLGVALVGEHPNANVQRGSVTAWNIGGPLPAVLQRLSAYSGLFHHYRDGVITFSPDAQFMTTLPPVEDLIEPVAGVVRSLGATDVQVDRFNRILSFRANRTQLPRIEAYLRFARERRQVITYDVSIYEVQLTDATQMGVNWNRFAVGGGRTSPWYQTQSSTGGSGGTGAGAGATAGAVPSVLPDWYPFRGTAAGEVAQAALNITGTTTGGMNINPFFVLPGLSADVLLNFLQTQGTLRSISQPRVSMLTGSKAAVRVGSTTTYVSKIGTNTGTAVTSTSVETAQLKTGVDLRINADYQDGTVFTDLQIAINDLVRMRSYVALGTTLQLPDTSDRLIETKVRARPGDTIVIGGIQRESSSIDADGAPFVGGNVIPTQRNKQALKSELVITLLPRVVTFASVARASATPVALESTSPPAAVATQPSNTAPTASPTTSPRPAARPPVVNLGQLENVEPFTLPYQIRQGVQDLPALQRMNAPQVALGPRVAPTAQAVQVGGVSTNLASKSPAVAGQTARRLRPLHAMVVAARSSVSASVERPRALRGQAEFAETPAAQQGLVNRASGWLESLKAFWEPPAANRQARTAALPAAPTVTPPLLAAVAEPRR